MLTWAHAMRSMDNSGTLCKMALLSLHNNPVLQRAQCSIQPLERLQNVWSFPFINPPHNSDRYVQDLQQLHGHQACK